MISCGLNPCGIQLALIEYGDALHLSLLLSVLYVKTVYYYKVMWSKLQTFFNLVFPQFKIPVVLVIIVFIFHFLFVMPRGRLSVSAGGGG